jgi:hypothetical protein
MLTRSQFHEFYLGYLSFLGGRKFQGSELIFRVRNYSLDGKETGNPRKIYKIEKEVLFIEELSERHLFNQCTENELYAIYEHYQGDLLKIKLAQPRKEKILDTFHNFIEFKRPILVDMIENYLMEFNRLYL